MRDRLAWLPAGVIVVALFVCVGARADEEADLAGVWEATRRFGPEVRGTLTLETSELGWRAEIDGYSVRARVEDESLVFELPGDRGRFRGAVPSGERLVGHWVQPRTRHSGREVASPVVLRRIDDRRWRGEVVPFEDDFTFYLVVEERDDGSLGAFLRNPERNFGIILNVDRLESDGDIIRLIGSIFRNTEETVLAEGSYSPGIDMISLMIRGASFDFERVAEDPGSHFYGRGAVPGRYVYRTPPKENDGWSVGRLEDVGIALDPLIGLIRTEIDPHADSLHDLYIHAMLIARHGKLVFEDYFHGFDRLTPHDTRSASKSATAVLVGAAMEAGAPLDMSTPVYETIHGDLSADLDERKKRMTVEHLLTMSSGFECDDSDSESRGNEDVMQSQEENHDWYDYTLTNPMVREPGELAVYCSANSNLLGSVLSRATDESLEVLFHRWIAEPLGVGRYHLVLQPTGEPYMGGGIQWLPRDFMKLGQLMLNGGTWNGRRILGEEYAAKAISPLYEMRRRDYGYQWWQKDYPYRDGTVRAFYAGGNGGQVVIGIPELDLLVTFFAGNYSDRVLYRIQDELVPQYILPAVDSER